MKKIIIGLIALFPLTIFAENGIQNSANEISQHYAASPNFYDFNAVKQEKISDKIIRQYVMGSQSMLVKWTLKKDAVIPLHFHPNEQITWITKGSVKVLSQGKEFIVKAGGVLILPSYAPHEFHALEDTIDIDFFTPVREDWINNTANYIQNVQTK